ncbi:sialin-like [Ruditapes philippinarum]|uniref:sialin-like n=1 Tax=Ruditapes philippinarum TaxID=129788 RepID=UPI00295B799C|nr:sialin-like [Ruditapes philippinarum]
MQLEGENKSKSGCFLCSCRFSLIIIAFFGCMNMYSLRVNMSVAIVCMTEDHIHNKRSSNTSKIDSANTFQENITENIVDQVTFNLGTGTTGDVIGVGCLVLPVPTIPTPDGSSKYGGKQLLGWCMLLCAIATIITPFAATSNVILLIAVRGFAGLCQGVALPCMHKLLSLWIPPLQRSRAVSFVYAGFQFGIMVTFPYSGVLCVDGFDGGWPSIFYVSGCVGVIWFVAWMFCVFDSPVRHPRISEQEKIYILQKLQSEVDIRKTPTTTPWSKILSSCSVWAIIVSQACSEWGLYTFMTNIPSYMEDVLQFQIKNTGFLSSLPYLGFWFVSNITALIADCIQRRKCMSKTLTRKLLSGIGNILPAISIAIMANIAENPDLAVTLLTIGVAISGMQFGSGYLVNSVEVAPMYAGIIMAFSNSAGSLCGFLAPFVIGFIVEDGTQEQWKTVFYITAGIYIFGSIFFAVFASGEVQPWALEDDCNMEIEVTNDRKKKEINTMENNSNHQIAVVSIEAKAEINKG